MFNSNVAGWVGSTGTANKQKAKLKNGRWTNDQLENAINAVTDEGMKLRAIAKAFGISATSLRDHLYGTTTTRQRGNWPTFKPDEEQKLVDYVFKIQELGHLLTPVELRLKVALATQTRQTP